MKKIKFRGKTIFDRWEYGSLITCDNYECKIGTCRSNGNVPFTYKVDNDTVGQFIGVYDINDEEIYEGDIIDFDTKIKYEPRVVTVHHRKVVGNLGAKGVEPFCNFGVNEMKNIEVVGNIYDNPEMKEYEVEE